MPPAEDGTVTWAELLADASCRIDPGEARHLLAECLGVGVGELTRHLDRAATQRGVAQLDAMVARRAAGEPLQYVLGSWSFRTLDLMVDRRVLIPRPETEQVVEVALAELDAMGGDRRPTTVVDLGTGSGAVALSIASERPRSTVWATDVSTDALAVASANTAAAGRAATRVSLVRGDWFDALPAELEGVVDLVVSNPPYVADDAELPAEVRDWEPEGALRSGPDGTDALRRILADAPRWLRPGGALVAELSPEQVPAMVELASRHFARVGVEPDLAGRPRALVAAGANSRPGGGAPG